jgi:hypothetical protein
VVVVVGHWAVVGGGVVVMVKVQILKIQINKEINNITCVGVQTDSAHLHLSPQSLCHRRTFSEAQFKGSKDWERLRTKFYGIMVSPLNIFTLLIISNGMN